MRARHNSICDPNTEIHAHEYECNGGFEINTYVEKPILQKI